MARLEFELVYYNVAAQHVTNYSQGRPILDFVFPTLLFFVKLIHGLYIFDQNLHPIDILLAQKHNVGREVFREW